MCVYVTSLLCIVCFYMICVVFLCLQIYWWFCCVYMYCLGCTVVLVRFFVVYVGFIVFCIIMRVRLVNLVHLDETCVLSVVSGCLCFMCW